MKKIIGLLILVTLVSCGPRRPGKLGASGTDGKDGINGTDGEDGYSLVVDVVSQTVGTVNCNRTDIFQDKDRNNFYSVGDTYQNGFLTCDGAVGPQGLAGQNGVDGQDGTDGINGQDGINGTDGEDGTNGQSAYEIAVAHGFTGTVTDYLNSLVGATGAQGQQGLPGINANTTYQITSVIDPCGLQHPQGFDEVILKLGNGQYLASFSDNANGKNTRFGILPNGNYTTTDETGCHFSLPIL